MNLGEIITAVQRQFGDESEVQVKKLDIIRWANQAGIDIARKTECVQDHAQTSSLTSDNSYTLPENYLGIRRVTYDDIVLQPTSMEIIDQDMPSRDKAPVQTGTPVQYYIWANTLYLHPAPQAGGTGNLDIFYYRTPALVSGNEDIIEIPAYYHEDVIRYCLARAKELDNDHDVSRVVMQEYNERIVQSMYEQQNPGSRSYPAVRLLPGDDW